MCIIFFAYQPAGGAHGYKLVLAANRDENFDRPSKPAEFRGAVLSGVDLASGKEPNGTWIGITRSGRFGALTNFRQRVPLDASQLGRGVLVRDFLEGSDTPQAYAEAVSKAAHRYGGFSILVGQFGAECDLWIVANEGDVTPRRLAPNIYGLSNYCLDHPWAKLLDGKQQLANLLEQRPEVDALTQGLLNILRTDTIYEDTTLPPTGTGMDWEQQLSTIFVRYPAAKYGTRAQTIVLVANDNTVHFLESVREGEDKWTSQSWEFPLEAAAPGAP